MNTAAPLAILVVDDDPIVHQTIGDYLRDSGHQVDETTDGAVGLKMIETHDYDLALVDLRMPSMDGFELLSQSQRIGSETSIVLITGHGNMEAVIQALRLGAADFLTKPVALLELDAVLEKCARLRELQQEGNRLRHTIRHIQASEDHDTRRRKLVGTSEAMRQTRHQIRQAVSASVDTIMVTGETGTGKEVVAREIHSLATSDETPFIALSCPALPESLVESELFGHVKGAFTGATTAKPGHFELADGSTLFLDEVGDLSLPAQAKLLRALDTRTFTRLGGTREIQVDVRVIAATNVPLEDMVKRGKFRRDLLYRLNVYPIHLLPLRQRREDIIPLAEHFLSQFAHTKGRRDVRLSSKARETLMGYNWLGNARELRNMIERAAILCPTEEIRPEHIWPPSEMREPAPLEPVETAADRERAQILQVLEERRWNRRQAAKRLGMPYSTLRYKMNKLGIG